jgi:protein phosphatase 2C
MEDACVAVPYLVEVPVSSGGMDELLPPRIAPQLRSSGSGGSALSDHTRGGARGSSSSGAMQPPRRGSEQRQQQLPGRAVAMAIDAKGGGVGAAALAAGISTEILHFFGVFDGHGGADAALHCAKSLHERVREVLTAVSSAPSVELLAAGGGAPSVAAAPSDLPQGSSSSGSGRATGNGGRLQPGGAKLRPASAAGAGRWLAIGHPPAS